MTWHPKTDFHPKTGLHRFNGTLIYHVPDGRFRAVALGGDVLVFLEEPAPSAPGLYLIHSEEGEALVPSSDLPAGSGTVGRLVGIMRAPSSPGCEDVDPARYVAARDAQGIVPVIWHTGSGPGEVYEAVLGAAAATWSTARPMVCPDLARLAVFLRRERRVIYGRDMTVHPSTNETLRRLIGSARMSWRSWLTMQARRVLRLEPGGA